MTWKIIAIGIAAIVTILVAVLGRYEMTVIPTGDSYSYVYRLDRWTGSVEMYRGTRVLGAVE
jgi:hypothetical protein